MGDAVRHGLAHDNHLGKMEIFKFVGNAQAIAGVENGKLESATDGLGEGIAELSNGQNFGFVEADLSLLANGMAVACKK